MKILEELSEGCTILGPDGLKWKQAIIAFFDDTRQYNNVIQKLSLLDIARDDLHRWRSLLRLTGGDINASKCSLYYLQWKQDTYGCMSMCDTDIDDLTINMGTSTSPSLTTIKRNDNKTPNKYIGITTAPNGNKIDSHKVLKK